MTDAGPIAERADAFRVLGGHPRIRAALISLCCLVLGAGVFVVTMGIELEQRGGSLPVPLLLLLPLDVLIGLAASIAVGPARGSRGGNIAVVLAAAVSTWALPAWIVSTVRLGSRRSYALDAALVSVFTIGAVAYAWLRELAAGSVPSDLPLIALVAAAGAAAVLFWGHARGTRAALVVALRGQANSAEVAHRAALTTRDAQIAATRAEERSSIARDMHDGISHQLAIVAMHAGALEYRTDLTAEQQRSAAGTVRHAAADASSMLREALTALRDPDDLRPTAPLPDSSSIDRLISEARGAGHTVELTWNHAVLGDLDAVPGRAPTCVRILEELLMNARKYAPEAPISIRFDGVDKGIVLRVSNPAPLTAQPRAGTGLGLLGVTERAQLLGGTAEYGQSASGTFDVTVTLP